MILKHENDIGRRNKDNFWRDNIAKEMAEVGIAFKVLEDVKVAPIGWKKVTFHLVCNIKCISLGSHGGSYMDTRLLNQ